MISITGPKIYTEQHILPTGTITIENGLISSISDKKNQNATFQFPSHYHLIPGFIDLHVHGANGSDVMDGSFDALKNIAKTLASEGTTSFLATTMTGAFDDIEKSLETIAHFQNDEGATILGVHLEGPFVSPEKAGAQFSKYMLPPDISLLEKWQKISNNKIKMVTFAPELVQSKEWIAYLLQQKIIPALGHSVATFTEARDAIASGANYVTHLFNAMRALHQREPGLAGAALLSDEVYTEIIVDGVHLHPAIVDLIFRVKNKEKIILITDAMRAKCMKDGTYDLGGQSVQVTSGVATLPNGALAGSTLKMPTALKNMLQFTRTDFYGAVKMGTENPAKALGIFHQKGSIALHKDADLVVLDDNFQVVLTIREGKIISLVESKVHAID